METSQCQLHLISHKYSLIDESVEYEKNAVSVTNFYPLDGSRACSTNCFLKAVKE